MHNKHTLPLCAGIAFASLLLANSSARAGLISWGYNWEPNTTKLTANAGGSGYLSLTDEPSHSATGASNTVVTDIRSVSNASIASPDTFNHANVSYTLDLTDSASNKSGALTFSGYFSGTITANNSNVQFILTSPTTQTLSLGGNTYSVSIGTFTPPGPSGAVNAGALNAFVTMTAGSGGTGTISSVPEPPTLVLVGLALQWIGLYRWRSRRKRRQS